jgi:hypothetical protein
MCPKRSGRLYLPLISSIAINNKGRLELVDGFLRLKWREESTAEAEGAECACADVDRLLRSSSPKGMRKSPTSRF